MSVIFRLDGLSIYISEICEANNAIDSFETLNCYTLYSSKKKKKAHIFLITGRGEIRKCITYCDM